MVDYVSVNRGIVTEVIYPEGKKLFSFGDTFLGTLEVSQGS